jgi:hypothetical protein
MGAQVGTSNSGDSRFKPTSGEDLVEILQAEQAGSVLRSGPPLAWKSIVDSFVIHCRLFSLEGAWNGRENKSPRTKP